MLVITQDPGPHGAIPRDGPLADVVLERGQIRGRVEEHLGEGRVAARG